MMPRQMAEDYARGMIDAGKSVDEANVEIVRMVGVQIVTGRLPQSVRAAFNAAVKRGYLGRLPKDGLRPEAFFHPNSRAKALERRDQIFNESVRAIQRVFSPSN